jgi:uncharacterized protein YjbJ (UPF0337 family)
MMGEFIDKAKGAVNEAIGKGKQDIARDQGNDDLAAEGAAQEGKGKLQDVKGSIKGAINDL